MKLTAIVAGHTDDLQTGFRTDPPLTDEVLHEALKNQWGNQYSHVYGRSGALLIVIRSSISKDDIENIEMALTNAEKAIERKKGALEKERQERLNYLSAETGLPVE